MKRVIADQKIQEYGQDDLAILLNISQADLEMFLEIVNLPNLLNNLINLEQYALATKQICLYYSKIRPSMTGKGFPKILKLVDKEVIGVLQQKLCKIILLNLQTSF